MSSRKDFKVENGTRNWSFRTNYHPKWKTLCSLILVRSKCVWGIFGRLFEDSLITLHPDCILFDECTLIIHWVIYVVSFA